MESKMNLCTRKKIAMWGKKNLYQCWLWRKEWDWNGSSALVWQCCDIEVGDRVTAEWVSKNSVKGLWRSWGRCRWWMKDKINGPGVKVWKLKWVSAVTAQSVMREDKVEVQMAGYMQQNHVKWAELNLKVWLGERSDLGRVNTHTHTHKLSVDIWIRWIGEGRRWLVDRVDVWVSVMKKWRRGLGGAQVWGMIFFFLVAMALVLCKLSVEGITCSNDTTGWALTCSVVMKVSL